MLLDSLVFTHIYGHTYFYLLTYNYENFFTNFSDNLSTILAQLKELTFNILFVFCLTHYKFILSIIFNGILA